MAEEGKASGRFTSGDVLGEKYVLRDRVGAGGAGEVWSAINRATRGTVALKIVGSGSPEAIGRFRHEALLSASLTHRNIVRVFDLFEEANGILVLVMEYLRGENARDRLLRTGRLSTSSSVSIATQILSALSHAHSLGIVHRDIKPPNIFLATEPDGGITPKLLDFGIAKTAVSNVQTSHGQLLGTPRYMSPEQIRAEEVDGRSDLFALAVVLYELLTGRSPFAAGFATASLAAVLEAPVMRDPLIPDVLWQVIEKALSKDRDARFASADGFAEALRDAVAQQQSSLSHVLVRSKPPPPIALDIPGSGEDASIDVAAVPRASRVRNIGLAIVGGAALLAAIGGIRAMTRHPAEAVLASAPPAQPIRDHAAEAVQAHDAQPATVVSIPPPSIVSPPSAPPPMPVPHATTARAPVSAMPKSTPRETPSAHKQVASEGIVKDPGF